jgi:hypothetical protein
MDCPHCHSSSTTEREGRTVRGERFMASGVSGAGSAGGGSTSEPARRSESVRRRSVPADADRDATLRRMKGTVNLASIATHSHIFQSVSKARNAKIDIKNDF